MSTQFQGEYPIDTAMTVRWRYGQPLTTAPDLYAYTTPSLTEGQVKLTLWRYTPTSLTVAVAATAATISGTLHSWVSCTYSYTPATAGDYIGVFSWKLGGVTAHGIVLFYARPTSYSPSSDGDGRIIGLHSFPRGDAQHLVYQTMSGELVAKQNPQ